MENQAVTTEVEALKKELEGRNKEVEALKKEVKKLRELNGRLVNIGRKQYKELQEERVNIDFIEDVAKTYKRVYEHQSEEVEKKDELIKSLQGTIQVLEKGQLDNQVKMEEMEAKIGELKKTVGELKKSVGEKENKITFLKIGFKSAFRLNCNLKKSPGAAQVKPSKEAGSSSITLDMDRLSLEGGSSGSVPVHEGDGGETSTTEVEDDDEDDDDAGNETDPGPCQGTRGAKRSWVDVVVAGVILEEDLVSPKTGRKSKLGKPGSPDQADYETFQEEGPRDNVDRWPLPAPYW